ncbi:hypothetical protein Tco_0352773 [Tanacetum coccineum]
MPRQAARGHPFGLKPKSNFVYRPVQPTNKKSGKTNSVSTSGKKMQDELSRQEVSNSNPFDTLNLVENDDDLGTNGGNSKLVEKGADSCVVSSTQRSSLVTSGSLNITPLVERTNKIERQMLDKKLVLADDDEKQLNKGIILLILGGFAWCYTHAYIEDGVTFIAKSSVTFLAKRCKITTVASRAIVYEFVITRIKLDKIKVLD